MGFIAPAGRTSSLTWEGKVFQVQTEFITRPSPKVVSSIILDGKLIHKVEKMWKGKLNDEGQHQIEQFLKKEHEAVAKALKKNPYDFLSGKTDEFQSIVEKLCVIKEIDNPFILRYNGAILYPEKKEDELLYSVSKLLAQALRLGQAVADSSRIGELRSGVLEYEQHKIIWIYYNERFWAAFTRKGSPIDETLKAMGNLIQEIYE